MSKDVPNGRSCYVSALRQELIARNSSYASLNLLPHVTSYGELPVVVYQQSECGRYHGNFISASYRAILRRPEWRKRLQKVHSQGRRSLPARDGSWRELDSSLSSDALLMNIFCYPGVTRRTEVCRILGLEARGVPEFGFMPRVPLLSEATERTEIDMNVAIRTFVQTRPADWGRNSITRRTLLFQPGNRNCFALIRVEQHRTKSRNPALSFHQ